MLRRLLGRRGAAPPAAPDPHAPPLVPTDPLAGSSPADVAIVERAFALTMTGVPRLLALVDAVRHVVERRVPGALAECGVWRGGSVLAMALTLADIGARDRDLYLYDTFEGMTRPGEQDVSAFHPPALETWCAAEAVGAQPWQELFDPAACSAEAVRATVLSSGHPPELVHLVEGPVQRTLPQHAPAALALLRLDTDWYDSTRHELEHLYPRLSPGGVLIVDDYGHWEGARRAVDEYFDAHPPRPLLVRVDYTARLAVKA